MAPSQLLELARLGAAVASRRRKLFLLNSRTRIALQAGAHGVHLPCDADVSEAIGLRESDNAGRLRIGKSVHSLEEALEAQAQGVDYVLLSPVLRPISKGEDRRPVLGLQGLAEAAQRLQAPVFALGGMTLGLEAEAVAAGAAGIAGISWVRGEIEAAAGQSWEGS